MFYLQLFVYWTDGLGVVFRSYCAQSATKAYPGGRGVVPSRSSPVQEQVGRPEGAQRALPRLKGMDQRADQLLDQERPRGAVGPTLQQARG